MYPKSEDKLRLHMENWSMNTEFKSPPHITLAIQHCSELNQEPYKWAELVIDNGKVEIEIGGIFGNGNRERSIATRSYYMGYDGLPTYCSHIHP